MARPHPALLAVAVGNPLVDAADASHLITSASEHRMVGLLAEAIAASGLELPEHDTLRLLELERQATHHSMTLWKLLAGVLDRLAEVGLEPYLFKGPALERRWYRPGQRPHTDLDLVLPPGRSLGAALRALDPEHPLAGRADHLASTGHLQSVEVTVDGQVVDLHVDPLKLGFPSHALGWFAQATTEIPGPEGRQLRVPTPEAALLQGLVHHSRDRLARLIGHVDCLRLASTPGFDWDRFWEGCRPDGLEPIASAGLAAISADLDVPTLGGERVRSLRRWVWERWFPASLRLAGEDSRFRYRLRSRYGLAFLCQGRLGDALRGFPRWAFPPPDVAAHLHGSHPDRYLTGLVRERLRWTRERRRLIRASRRRS